MPIPKPKQGESKTDFISRCMSNPTMVQEYPEQEQRSAVCYSQWNDKERNNNEMRYKCTQCGKEYAEGGKNIVANGICPSCKEGELHMLSDTVLAHNDKREGMKANSLKHLMSALVKDSSLEGQDCWVIPTVLICEGVHNGIFYPAEELAKFPDAWNGVPIPIEHPDEDGQPITCNTPELIEKQTVGRIFNVHYEHPKLIGEAWVYKNKVGKVNGGELFEKMLDEGKNIEVSTGLFIEEEMTSGMWEGEPFSAIARNHRPDHLALLPGGKGACSWEDGGGMPRINARGDGQGTGGDKQGDGGADSCVCPSCGTTVNHDRGTPCNDVSCPKCGTAMKGQTANNELSHDSVRMQLQGLLQGKKANDQEYIYVDSVFDGFVIYEHETSDAIKLLKQAYSVDANEMVQLVGDEVEVTKQISFVPVANADDNSLKKNKKKEGVMPKEREEKVNALIANEKSEWAEDDKDFLMGLEDDQFEKVEKGVQNAEEPVENEDEDKGDADGEGSEEPETNEDKPKTLDEFIEEAPAEMQDTLRRAVERDKEIKDNLVKSLKANKRCKFTMEQLSAKSISELEALAELAQEDVDYSGQGGNPVVNDDQDSVPAAPEMKFNKDGSPNFDHLED